MKNNRNHPKPWRCCHYSDLPDLSLYPSETHLRKKIILSPQFHLVFRFKVSIFTIPNLSTINEKKRTLNQNLVRLWRKQPKPMNSLIPRTASLEQNHLSSAAYKPSSLAIMNNLPEHIYAKQSAFLVLSIYPFIVIVAYKRLTLFNCHVNSTSLNFNIIQCNGV